MDDTVVKLYRLASDTASLRNNSWNGRVHTKNWWDCAVEACGEIEPLLPLVHFLAVSGEGLDVLQSMVTKK